MKFRELPSPVSSPAPRRRAGGLILLVEDDFVLRSSLSELLSMEGFRVECCADGRDAFRRLLQPPMPDLILLDIMLPHLDGFEFRALQRKVLGFSHIPVVVISAHDLDRRSLDELELPLSFRKPLDIELLLTTMRELTATPA
jgi:DNA-binding response OmpR family regulator